MLIPNNTAIWSRASGYNVDGETQFGPPQVVACAVVRLTVDIKRSPIRSETSASKGNVDEVESIAKILFPATAAAVIGDKVEIAGVSLRVIASRPQYSVEGRLDHFENDFEHWAD